MPSIHYLRVLRQKVLFLLSLFCTTDYSHKCDSGFFFFSCLSFDCFKFNVGFLFRGHVIWSILLIFVVKISVQSLETIIVLYLIICFYLPDIIAAFCSLNMILKMLL